MKHCVIVSILIILIIIIILYLGCNKENFQADKNIEDQEYSTQNLIDMFNSLEVAEKRCEELEERQQMKNDMFQLKQNEAAFNELEELDKKIQELKELLKDLNIEKKRRDNINDKCKENKQIKLNENYDLLGKLNKNNLVSENNMDLNLNISDSLKSLGFGNSGTAKNRKDGCNVKDSKTHVNIDKDNIKGKCNGCDVSKLKKNYAQIYNDFK